MKFRKGDKAKILILFYSMYAIFSEWLGQQLRV